MPETPIVPAGWYPDPAGSERARWWDGSAWTEQYTANPSPTAAPLLAPEGVSWSTVWIWLILAFLPASAIARGFLPSSTTVVTGSQLSEYVASRALVEASFQLLVVAISVAITAVLAFLDRRELVERGVPAPFPWAWALLGYVYPIGRGIVVHRRTGRGRVVTWIALGTFLVFVVLSIATRVVYQLLAG